MGRGLGPGRVVLLASCGALALTGACNAINGAGDLTTTDCPSCLETADAGSGDAELRRDAGAGGDASPDALVDQPGGFVDPSFGVGGFVVSQQLDVVTSVAVRADGKIAVAGSSRGQLAVARFAPDGTPDATFGSGGLVIAASSSGSRADAVTFDAQGRVVAAGTAAPPPVLGGGPRAYVVRIADDGTLDPTFGQGGRNVFNTSDEGLSAIAVAATGEILLGGTTGALVGAPGDGKNTRGAVWRMSAAGGLTALGRIDVAYAPNGASSTVAAVSLGTTGLVFAGRSNDDDRADFGVGRLVDGAFDPSFAGGVGRATVAVGSAQDRATAVGRLSDDSIVIGGEVQVGPTLGLPERTPQFGLVRLLPNGVRDTAWGKGGAMLVPFGPGSIFAAPESGDYLRGLVVDARDRVVAVGYVNDTAEGASLDKIRAVVIRVRAGGVIDPLFGQKGALFISFGKPTEPAVASAVALQPDGKIVVAGTSSDGLALARVTP